VVALSTALGGCTAEAITRVPDAHDLRLPEARAAEVEMDEGLLRRWLSELPAPAEHGLHSALVMRRGRVVLEQYWNGYDRTALQDLRSATKSLTALLVGVAIDRGALSGVDEPVRTTLGGAFPDLDARLTLAHLLTMRSGLACDDRDPRSPGQEEQMYRAPDWARFFLELPRVEAPGEGAAHYCTGGAVLLGRVLATATGRPVPAFAAEVLFGPLGIHGEQWASFDEGRQTDTGGHLSLRPEDLARIGQLMLQHGAWAGRQLVSRAWIDQATAEHTHLDGAKPYGYLWWRTRFSHQGHPVEAFFAGGNGGQYLFVVPELELVAVFTGGNYNSPKAHRPFEVMKASIIPSVLR
jgi:CubicO group peptidase (beta-lactamase class C family)